MFDGIHFYVHSAAVETGDDGRHDVVHLDRVDPPRVLERVQRVDGVAIGQDVPPRASIPVPLVEASQAFGHGPIRRDLELRVKR